MTRENADKPFKACPVCGSSELAESLKEQTFPAGSEGAGEVSALVPMMHCANCDFMFTDHRAEAIRHDAVCRHLGLLTPDEIRHIREDVYGMSRKAFAEAFKFGEASLERWENRKLFQNSQADVLLRLLADPEIGHRVRSWSERRVQEGSIDPTAPKRERRYSISTFQ
jgi:putative zinc finger/helix-turn-helix YgiT family protein